MKKNEPFCCPHCGKKLPFAHILKVKNGHVFDCPFCGEAAMPKKTKSFAWGYGIGFLSFAIPQQIILYLHQDFWMAFLIGSFHAVLAFLLVSLYLYFHTRFIKASSYII